MYYSTTCTSPIGTLTLASSGDSLAGLWIEGQKYFGQSIPEEMTRKDELEIFELTRRWLDRYFTGRQPSVHELPLSPAGSDFRKDVWDLLCEIPYGTVTTYGAIARKLAERTGRKSMAGQAVGGAVGHNPISTIIPCHRVVGSDGSLTGYAGGIDTKIKLLKLEGVDVSQFFAPSSHRLS